MPEPAPVTLEAEVRRGLLRRRYRLELTDTAIRFAPAASSDGPDWLLRDIEAVRFGYWFPQVYRFRLGTSYEVALQRSDGEELHIRFYSFSSGEDEYWEVYVRLVEALQQRVVRRLLANARRQLAAGQAVEFDRVAVTDAGLQVPGKGLIPWAELDLQQTHRTWFFNSLRVPGLYVAVQPQQLWNAPVLLALVKAARRGRAGS